MKARRGTIAAKVRLHVLQRYKFTCVYCGAHPPAARIEIDHFWPIALGGRDSEDNLVVACILCNRSKGAGWPLTQHPFPPNDSGGRMIVADELIERVRRDGGAILLTGESTVEVTSRRELHPVVVAGLLSLKEDVFWQLYWERRDVQIESAWQGLLARGVQVEAASFQHLFVYAPLVDDLDEVVGVVERYSMPFLSRLIPDDAGEPWQRATPVQIPAREGMNSARVEIDWEDEADDPPKLSAKLVFLP